MNSEITRGRDSPLISVIIPTYNRAGLIKETIESVCNQTYENLEILVIDDGSTDNTEQVTKSINDDRIKYFRQEHRGRPAPARNKGIQRAKGQFIAFLDSDDLWVPRKLETQLGAFQRYPDILLVCSNGKIFSSHRDKYIFNMLTNKRLSFRSSLMQNLVLNSSVLMRKNVAESVGSLDEDIRLRAVEDYDYWLRILKYKDKSILVLKGSLISRRLRSENIGITSTPDAAIAKYEKLLLIYSKHEDYDIEFINKIKQRRIFTIESWAINNDFYNNKIGLYELLRSDRVSFFSKIKAVGKFCKTSLYNSLFSN